MECRKRDGADCNYLYGSVGRADQYAGRLMTHTELWKLSLYAGNKAKCPIAVAVWCEAQICSPFIAGIAGSNRDDGMDIRVLCWLFAVQVASSVSTRSLLQRSHKRCVSTSVWSCNLKIRQFRTNLACSVTEKK